MLETGQILQQLAWVLVHFVWQGTVVAVVLATFLPQFRRPQTRYLLYLIGLLVMAVCPVFTFLMTEMASKPVAVQVESSILDDIERATVVSDNSVGDVVDLAGEIPVNPQQPATDLANVVVVAAEGGTFEEVQSDVVATKPFSAAVAPQALESLASPESLWSRVTPWIVSCWLLGVVAFSLRLLFGWIGLWRLRRNVSTVPQWIETRTQFLAKTLRCTCPVIRLSKKVGGAMAIGFIKPVILLPVSWATELPSDMLDAVIAHELAHIRRHDLWVNLLQRIIETLFFYHPAVWWASHQLRSERELCCDETVVAVTQNPIRYAETLEHIARLSLASADCSPSTNRHAALTVSIGGPQKLLLSRIRAVLKIPPERHSSQWQAGLIPLGLACLLAWSLIGHGKAPADDTRTETISTSEQAADVESERPENVESSHHKSVATYRGQIVTQDGSPLPADLKLQRRISGAATEDTPINANGEFWFESELPRTSVRFSTTATGFAPFDSKWIKPDQPLKLTLVRGATVRLRLIAPQNVDGPTGTASLIVPWWDNDKQGTFSVNDNGVITIPHCPLTTVKLDLLVPGFEEIRIHRLISGDVSLNVPLSPSKPTELRIVTDDGRPVAGAKVRLFGRVREHSLLQPYFNYGDGPIWGTSNSDGRVELTNLRAIDPVRTNDPGKASYAFRIDAPGFAPQFVADVTAGSDVGDVSISPALQITGELVRNSQDPEHVRLQYRQPSIAQGGNGGRGGWEVVEPVEVDGKLTFRLSGLKSGKIDMFILYENAMRRSPGKSTKQMQFLGTLSGDSSGLVISRESVSPGDDNLIARRQSLSVIGDDPRSNLPDRTVEQLVGGSRFVKDNADTLTSQWIAPEIPVLFAWSNTAPVRHSMGAVTWRLFILQDGTVIIPSNRNIDAGTRYKLTRSDLQEFKNLLANHKTQFTDTVSPPSGFDGWRSGYQRMRYNPNGTISFLTQWYGQTQSLVENLHTTGDALTQITEYVTQLMRDASCGGPEAKAGYLRIANKALVAAIPDAVLFTIDSRASSTNETDGTRSVTFVDAKHGISVKLIHPTWGQIYVERIEQFNKRVTFDALAETDAAEPNNISAKKQAAQLGSLKGRFVYSGELSEPWDMHKEFRNIVPQQQPSTDLDWRLRSAEQVYRSYVNYGIRPVTENARAIIGKDQGVADIVIWASSKNIPWSRPPEGRPPVTIRLKDGQFIPRVATVTTGQSLIISNDDPVDFGFKANFYRPLNTDIKLQLKPGATQQFRFRDPEQFPTHSNYLWATGAVFVHSNPYFAVTEPDGSFTLPDLPPGDWEFRAWQKSLGYIRHWPKGVLQQTIKPGENSLGAIQIKAESFGRQSAKNVTQNPPKNRTQIGELFGKPVYRDQLDVSSAHEIFLQPVWDKYKNDNHAKLTPTEDEVNFANVAFDERRRKGLEAEGGEAKFRKEMKEIEAKLEVRNLQEGEVAKLEQRHMLLETKLTIPEGFADFMLQNWKLQKHLYDNFGGGRILWQQAGIEAFDATRRWMEAQEKAGHFKLSDPILRGEVFDYWTKDHGSFLIDDADQIRESMLEPVWVAKPVNS